MLLLCRAVLLLCCCCAVPCCCCAAAVLCCAVLGGLRPGALTGAAALRWAALQELAGLFERLVAALTDGDLPAAAEAALRFAYYW